ncbi:Tetratricopeptide repeat protein [Rahnella bruchi]|uniref:tetratricopeptide repeat protein n=1 Tax=Rahnella bruchi TaxID=1510573 RepID=UPI0039F13595
MRATKYFNKPKYNRVNIENRLSNLALDFREAMGRGEYGRARACCEAVLAITPNNPSVLGDYALTLMRTGAYQESYEIYQKMYKSRGKTQYPGNWLDGLTEVCGWLAKKEELQQYGHESLSLADEICRGGVQFTLPSQTPAPFEPNNRSQNVISFSLYGASPKYCEVMIKNAQLSQEFYPGWTCRVYYNETVPEGVIDCLRGLGVQLFDMSNETKIAPTMWRFLVIDDPSVSRFLLRDADSLFSEKETAAVEEWLASSCWFHHMRDYFTHTELLLAGLWGGCSGVFSSVKELMTEFVHNYKGTARYTDQQFLRHVLWPTVRGSLLSHDEIFMFHGARPYPPYAGIRWEEDHFHIGSNASYSSIGGKVGESDNSVVTLRFESESHCVNYGANVQQGQWHLSLPFFLLDDFNSGKLKIERVEV